MKVQHNVLKSNRNIICSSCFALFVCIHLVISGSVTQAISATTNPFLGTPVTTEKNDTPQQNNKKEQLQQAPFSRLMLQISRLQMEMKQKISQYVRAFKEEGSFAPLVPLFLLAFGYGAIHAAGPGHGKAIAMTYALSKGKTFRSGIFLGSMIAFIHAGSAISIVLILHIILHKNVSSQLSSVTHTTELVSYTLLTLIGLFLLLDSFREWRMNKSNEGLVHKSCETPVTAAFAIGVVPCPGVLMILLFCISLNQVILGILLGITVSIGMALTISCAVWISLAGKKTTLLATSHWQSLFCYFEKSIHTLSALLLTFLGGLLLFSAIQ